MRILLAPDTFKGTLDAASFCRIGRDAIAAARSDIDCLICPLADGGEGTAAALVNSAGGEFRRQLVDDPLGRRVSASWGLLDGGRTAIIDLSASSGLGLVEPASLDPLVTSSRGTGELMVAALDAGCQTIILGLGGSATVDGGKGALSALGFGFLDASGKALSPGGASLQHLSSVDRRAVDPRVAQVEWLLASDVDNPLLGPSGAAQVYGPQKGAGPDEVQILEQALAQWVKVAGCPALALQPGAGAAGGAGFGLAAMLDARLVPGFDLVRKRVGLDQQMAGCDWVVTGEGQLDEQSLSGKVVGQVSRLAREHGVRCLVVAGQDRLEDHKKTLFDRVLSLVGEDVSAAEAQSNAGSCVARRLRQWAADLPK
jgi:glycerate kinase